MRAGWEERVCVCSRLRTCKGRNPGSDGIFLSLALLAAAGFDFGHHVGSVNLCSYHDRGHDQSHVEISETNHTDLTKTIVYTFINIKTAHK